MKNPKAQFKPVQIIGVASGHGAQDRGCASGPEVLREGGLVAQLAQRGMDVRWRAMLQPQTGDELSVVSTICAELAAIAETAFATDAARLACAALVTLPPPVPATVEAIHCACALFQTSACPLDGVGAETSPSASSEAGTLFM